MSSKTWVCPYCCQKNWFPAKYQGMSETSVPLELSAEATTIEYRVREAGPGIGFLMLVDTCVEEGELEELRGCLLRVLREVPSNSLVGLVTFGSTVQVYELGGEECEYEVVYAFGGEEEMSPRDMGAYLNVERDARQKAQVGVGNRFMAPYAKCRRNMEAALRNLSPDPFEVQKGSRPRRCMGMAVSTAICLLESALSGSGGRIMLFAGGPGNVGLGAIVGQRIKDPIRTHNELHRECAPYVHQASKFYSTWSEKLVANGHAFDMFSCSLNQTGLLEMRKLSESTGGIVVLANGFSSPEFQKSLFKLFEKDESGNLNMAFLGVVEVVVTSPLAVSGCVGHVSPMDGVGPGISGSPIGRGTNRWRVCALDSFSTLGIFFEYKPVKVRPKLASASEQRAVVQFRVEYQHASGARVQRVTTVCRTVLLPGTSPLQLIQGFDYECAAALFARLVVHKSEKEDLNCLAQIDKHLILLMKRFCSYTKDLPSSIQVPQELTLYSQFMYYFRRGPLIQIFNNTPDESVFFRFYLSRECVGNVVIMLQPTLDSYTLDSDPVPAFLSSSSITPNNVLLLDTFFHLVVHVGTTIAQWRDAGYHLNPEYENLKELLTVPFSDAQSLLSDRLPVPIYIECDQHTSQARFLIAIVDPATTHLTQSTIRPSADQPSSQVILTEDSSLQTFMNRLFYLTCKEN
ncbi:uncharacterized protein LOC126326033 [Schistocerca gregaria]|uniref:uncharacterized protein LOC126326033 n=1 Tax=Schistocerca gregaria TaxID=7010 RepID=UPI00211DBDD4|nr:uncharacterized protein LOC126326033 [Schistocerca gregaria]